MLFFKALNSVIRIPPTHPTMQPSTQVMVAHVNPTPVTTTRCPPYAHMPPPGLCRAPTHLALLVISTEHVESLFPGEKCVSEPPSASPLHDWMVKGSPIPLSVCYAHHGYSIGMRTNETKTGTYTRDKIEGSII